MVLSLILALNCTMHLPGLNIQRWKNELNIIITIIVVFVVVSTVFTFVFKILLHLMILL